METLMDKLDLDNRTPKRDQTKPQIRNSDFKRPIHPQIRQIEQQNPRNIEDQQIIPPFLQNFVNEEEENDPMDNQIHHFDDMDS